MFKVTEYPHGAFCWADGLSTDQKSADAFYQAVMGWSLQSIPIGDMGTYSMFFLDGAPVAGLGQMAEAMQAQGVPSHWTNNVKVDDVDALAGKVTELGGELTVPPMDVNDSGRMLMLKDPTGATLGLWQPKNHIGAGIVNTAGAMIWNELVTTDPEAAMTFYGELLGWEFSTDENMPNYWYAVNNGRMNGGILLKPDAWGDHPNVWAIYYNVADIDKTVALVEEHGGKLNVPIGETPIGRMAVISDPTNAVLSLIQSNTVDTWEE